MSKTEIILGQMIQADLNNDLDELQSDGQTVPTAAAVEACAGLADSLAIQLPGIRYVGFVEDGGVAGLIIRSDRTNRRLTCRFSSDGSEVTAHRLDESLRSDKDVIPSVNLARFRELVEWTA